MQNVTLRPRVPLEQPSTCSRLHDYGRATMSVSELDWQLDMTQAYWVVVSTCFNKSMISTATDIGRLPATKLQMVGKNWLWMATKGRLNQSLRPDKPYKPSVNQDADSKWWRPSWSPGQLCLIDPAWTRTAATGTISRAPPEYRPRWSLQSPESSDSNGHSSHVLWFFGKNQSYTATRLNAWWLAEINSINVREPINWPITQIGLFLELETITWTKIPSMSKHQDM